ncbi:MAG TPA: hypothetical protein VF575_02275 [Candidatus Saccharimonadales bacterium]|jgi:hypothetical protein
MFECSDPEAYGDITFHTLERLAEQSMTPLMNGLNAQINIDGPPPNFVLPTGPQTPSDVRQYLTTLSCIVNNGEFSPSAYETTNRAYLFAGSVARILFRSEPNISSAKDLQVIKTHDGYIDAYERLNEAATAYYETAPTIDGLVGAYQFELDPSTIYPHVAELVAGTTFMALEQIEQKRVAATVDTRFSTIITGFGS